MGRGRAKAKQVKVARQLKYKSDDTDLDRLRAELGVGADSRDGNSAGEYDDEDEDGDPGSSEDDWYEPRHPAASGRDASRRDASRCGTPRWDRRGYDLTPRPSSTCWPRSSSVTGIGYRPSKQARHNRLAGSPLASVSPSSDT